MYQNPIIRGFYPDPSVCRVGADFYLVTSSFEYFPGLPVFHSTDLITWSNIGHCLTRSDQVDLSRVPTSGGIWAPTLRYYDGDFFVITTVMDESRFSNELGDDDRFAGAGMTGRHFIVTAKDPAGPWSDPVWVNGDGLDPSLLFDDGQVYLTYADHGVIFQCSVNAVTGEHLSPPHAIWTGTDEVTSEGPHLYRVGDFYYLMVAEGGTSYGHSIAIARSSTPWGPWESHPSNPLLSHRNMPDHPLQATGHGDLVEDADGRWWLVFLAIRPQGWPPFHVLGRETCLAAVEWRDGWPFVNEPAYIDVSDEAKALLSPSWKDNFTAPVLAGHWNTVRGPDPTVSVGPAGLTLCPGADSQDEMWRSFVGTRQTEAECVAEARLVLRPSADRDEAGLTVRMNDRHHYDVGVVHDKGRSFVRLRRQVGSLIADSSPIPISAAPLTLRVTCTAWMYVFWIVGVDGSPDICVGKGEAFYLSTEVAGGFTGIYIGPYASGCGEADFYWFEIAN